MTDSAELVEVQLSMSLPLPCAQALYSAATDLAAGRILLVGPPGHTPSEQAVALQEALLYLADELHQQGVRRF